MNAGGSRARQPPRSTERADLLYDEPFLALELERGRGIEGRMEGRRVILLKKLPASLDARELSPEEVDDWLTRL